jgi:hypothetical protein
MDSLRPKEPVTPPPPGTLDLPERIEDELIAVAAGTVLEVKHLGN